MTTTTQLITIVGIMLAINVSLVMLQSGIDEVNPDGVQFFEKENSPYSNYVSDQEFLLGEEYLPSDENAEADTSGNIFTDTYKSMATWFKVKLAPLGFVGSTLTQPYGFFKDVGMPTNISLTFAMFWYLLAIILIVSWWGGR